MIRPRERPDIAGRLSLERDDDVARGRAADEPARRNRQVGALERPEDTTPNEAGRTVGADDPAAIDVSVARQDPPPVTVAPDVSRT